MLNDGSTTTTCSTLLPGRFKLQTGPRFVWSSSKVFMLRPVVEDHSLAWWKTDGEPSKGSRRGEERVQWSCQGPTDSHSGIRLLS